MNKFIVPILVVIALQFTVILSHPCNESEYPLIKTTACPRAAYTFGYNGFIYVGNQSVPQRTYVAKANRHPYVYSLREKLVIGQAVTIRGIIPESNDESVEISLLSKTPVVDLKVGAAALYMSINIRGKECVFNSIENGKLLPGFKTDNLEKPKTPVTLQNSNYDEEFEVVIRALTDQFEIILNGYHYADFPYRMPLEIIDIVNVQYNAIITELRIGGRYFKNISKIDFPGGYLKLNERVIIEGFSTADKFQINLLDAKGLRAFHIRSYYEPGVTIMNSEPWGQHQIDPRMPFAAGKHFALELTNRPDHIEINVNRAHFTKFEHRISNPENGYKALGFDDVVTIEGLEICTKTR